MTKRVKNKKNPVSQDTKLDNRESFISKVNILFKKIKNQKHAIIFFDINNFHITIEKIGYQNRNLLIDKIIQRIQPLLNRHDLFAHQETDRFLLCLSQTQSKKDLLERLESIILNFLQAFEIQQKKINLSISLGIAMYPKDGTDSCKLLNFAYSGWRHTKRNGSIYRFYDQHADEKNLYYNEIETQLPFALSKNEFHLVFQPQIDTEQQTIIGVEALIRWKNSKLGNVPPQDFIPLAEKNGLIFSISNWVIKQACIELQDILAAQKNFRLNINLSARELQAPTLSLINHIQYTLDKKHISPHQIEFELTETDVMNNYAIVINNIIELHRLGFSIACDDFGTGYSSLSYLKHLPIDTLKIDKSFIDNITCSDYDIAIIQAIVMIGKILGSRIIVEGVEHLEQVTALKKLGCNLLQGYYYSKPLPINELKERLRKGL